MWSFHWQEREKMVIISCRRGMGLSIHMTAPNPSVTSVTACHLASQDNGIIVHAFHISGFLGRIAQTYPLASCPPKMSPNPGTISRAGTTEISLTYSYHRFPTVHHRQPWTCLISLDFKSTSIPIEPWAMAI
jgi:hypothetical protein